MVTRDGTAPFWLLQGAVGLLVFNLLFLGATAVWLVAFRTDLAWAQVRHAELDARTRPARRAWNQARPRTAACCSSGSSI